MSSADQDEKKDHRDHDGEEGAACGPVHFTVNNHPHQSLDHTLTGTQIKDLDRVPATDELFLDTECGDEVITNETTVLVRNGDRFHTMPSPQYGDGTVFLSTQVADVRAVYNATYVDRGPNDRRLVLTNVRLPVGYSVGTTNILIRIPPLFPEARPDMFWARPVLTLASGQQPQATSFETIDGEQWQRFSWHLAPDGWQPGVSTLRDFVRAVVARLRRVG